LLYQPQIPLSGYLSKKTCLHSGISRYFFILKYENHFKLVKDVGINSNTRSFRQKQAFAGNQKKAGAPKKGDV